MGAPRGRKTEREEATTIIFHRQKRKGRMPFISPGSVGSHVVGAAACDTSITDQPGLPHRPTVAMVRKRVYVSTWTSYTRLPRAVSPYITDISPRRPLCSYTDISVIAGLNAPPCTPPCIISQRDALLRLLSLSLFIFFLFISCPPSHIVIPAIDRFSYDRFRDIC